MIDLHIHTYFSDGCQSPEEVAAAARERGLAVISVCDHDTIAAYDRLRPACAAAGLALVQGAEVDVLWRAERLHLLAYGFDPEDGDMRRMLDLSRAELDRVSVEMIAAMESDFPAISGEDYSAYEAPLGRGGWKGINYLLDRGMSENLMDGMRFLRKYGHYSPRFCAFEDACRTIRAAGGVPVLAHPGVNWHDQRDAVPGYLADLLARGLGGIECYYPWHDEGFTRMCAGFCREHGLRITCGGDGHGGFGRFVEGIEYDIGIMKTDPHLLDLAGIYGG